MSDAKRNYLATRCRELILQVEGDTDGPLMPLTTAFVLKQARRALASGSIAGLEQAVRMLGELRSLQGEPE